jgi:hypothetical protein
MDLSFEQNLWQNGAVADDQSGSESGEFSAPEWHVLRARLSAALAARDALLAADCAINQASGSFQKQTARILATFQKSSRLVNPTALGNGKVNGGIDDLVVGESLADARGNP